MVDRFKRFLADVGEWSLQHRLPRITRRAIAGFLRHEALQYAGSMAYFAVLSLFQLFVLGIVVGSFFLGQGEARTFVIEQVQAGSPLDAEAIGGVIDAAIESRGSIGVIGFAFLLWSALGIFSALSNGISRAFENAPPRPFLKDKLIGLLLMGVTGLLALASLVIGIVTGILQRAAQDVLADLPGGGAAVWLIGLLVPIVLIFLAFWIIYRVVPNRPVGWGEVLPGAVVASLLWTVLRFGFTWYATSVAKYDTAFGPLATGITLLVFLYFASVVVLLGAEFARASAVDDEVGRIATADPRLLPVPVGVPAPPPQPTSSRVPRWALLGVVALVGAVIGRLTKRDREYL
ncbi:MAG TPA: YihY/virulence factor BrkB family protein [Candidatus Limnocylindria bacterium]|jgi:membrane protein|nr:YihY/virulence factor BrkB family protein [Candidatus Limnocylindria bacterium]